MLRNEKHYSFFYRNGLSIVFLFFATLFLVSQSVTGYIEYLKFLEEYSQREISFISYLRTGHFLESTFENWESEFFQMALFVLLTVFLRQKGSSESKQLSGSEPVDREPKAHANAPWPVKRGGFVLALYKHSLSLSLLLLFAVSFILHWYGSNLDFNYKQELEGKPTEGMATYLGNSRLWFESFQNWQSEFLSVFALIVLSIYLREFKSPQSKPVDAPHSETGE